MKTSNSAVFSVHKSYCTATQPFSFFGMYHQHKFNANELRSHSMLFVFKLKSVSVPMPLIIVVQLGHPKLALPYWNKISECEHYATQTEQTKLL